ncbi:hypothetical protein [Sphingomonas sp. 1P08PE]|uniref:hypothetical protein n=1 Tax=Sphingomonas sp. 1P08PE TaxID=554122 RepID=UPI0039A07199
MADNDLTPMTDGDIAPPPTTTRFEPAAPLKNEGVDFSPADAGTDSGSRTGDARQAIRDGAGKVGQQATEKLRALADDGKSRAGSALDQLSQLLTDAAGQVDDKLGDQYGQYARSAADQVSGFADTIRQKDMDELLEDARGLVKASPAVAIGIAAALGFVVARLVQSGVDAQQD